MGILIIGGTGRVGKGLAAQLVERGEKVAILTRSSEKLISLPKGVDGRLGDLSNPQLLPGVMEGSRSLALITSQGETEMNEGIAAVEAAKKAGISRIVYLSVFKAESGSRVPFFHSKAEIQKAIEASGISFTILKASHFYQNDYLYERPIIDYGVYPNPVGDEGVNSVDSRDVVKAFANALLESGHEKITYPLVGPKKWTGKQIAEVYSKFLQRKVRYGGDNMNAWTEHVRTLLPPKIIADMRSLLEFIQLRGMIATEDDLRQQEKILKHPPRGYEDFVEETTTNWLKQT